MASKIIKTQKERVVTTIDSIIESIDVLIAIFKHRNTTIIK